MTDSHTDRTRQNRTTTNNGTPHGTDNNRQGSIEPSVVVGDVGGFGMSVTATLEGLNFFVSKPNHVWTIPVTAMYGAGMTYLAAYLILTGPATLLMARVIAFGGRA